MSYDSDPNPYQSPYQSTPNSTPSPGSVHPTRTPGVWYGYVVYCVIMALVNSLFVAMGIKLALMAKIGSLELLYIGIVVALICGVLVVMFAAAPLLPRNKSAWIYGFVTIGIGMITWLLPFCIVLLIFWLRPNTKAFFRTT